MTPPYFGQNPTNVNAVVGELGPHILANAQLHWAVLVDTAFDYEGGANLHNISDHHNCYADLEDLRDLDAVAPCIFPIDATEIGSKACTQLLLHASGRPMLSIIASQLPLAQLLHYWQPLHWAYSSDPADAQRFALRFADTRTLATLPTQLSPEQWQALYGPLAFWFIVNRAGKLELLKKPPADTAAAPSIALSAKTMGRMAQASAADSVLTQLASNAEEAFFADQAPWAMYQQVQAALALGHRHQVQGGADTQALAWSACASKGAAIQSPRLLELLIGKEYRPGKLAHAIAALKLA